MKKIKLYLLTGFLGAGKTTVLKEILKSDPNQKIGIIMNEFGKTGIDGGLVSDRSTELIEINRGSIFCDCLKLSFIESLKDMADKPIDHLFVEGSGLADPSNIGEILDAAQSLVGDTYDYRGSICVVDAPHFMEQSEDIEAMNRQVRFSHLAVISKTDLVGQKQIDLVSERIRSFNSTIRIEETDMGKIGFDVLKTDLTEGQEIQTMDTTNKKENKPKTLTLNIFETVNKSSLDTFLTELSKDAYRMKGFVELKDEGFMQVDVVNGRIDYKKIEAKKETQIVILSKIGPSIIKSIVGVWESQVGADYKLRN